jgi:hypothetical protein
VHLSNGSTAQLDCMHQDSVVACTANRSRGLDVHPRCSPPRVQHILSPLTLSHRRHHATGTWVSRCWGSRQPS